MRNLLLLLALLPACARADASERPEGVGVATLQTGQIQAKVVPTPVPHPIETPAACPNGMVLVEGEYCPDVEQKCLEWMDPPESRYAQFRCKKYEQPAKCKGARVHKRSCIDATERTEEGSTRPRHFMPWTCSKALCESQGARLCRQREWLFTCE